MSNYSEGTQVPFGDGSHVPPEAMTDSDSESDTTMQTAMKNIFLSCDPNNSNYALVSDLITFMTPHMQEHTSELIMLKTALDPTDTNPRVSSETFYKLMMEWTSQFTEEPAEPNNVHSISDGESNKAKEKDLPYASSLSKTSIGQRFLKGCIESDNMNLSNTSTYSYTGNSGADVTVLQEKINEIEHQNRKLNEDLEHCRTQLMNSEEHNEALQTEVQKISRRLLTEQQTNGQLEKDRQNTEELMEVSTAAQKQISKLEKDLASVEKQVSKLKQHIQNLETENQKFEDRNNQLVKRDAESKQLIQKLQAELHVKEQEITSLQEINAQVEVNLNEQKQLVSHYSNVNKSLKEDKLKMEQHYHDTIRSRILTISQTCSGSSHSSKSGTSKNPCILSPVKRSLNQPQENYLTSVNSPPIYKERQFHFPLAKLYKNKGFIYNSPRLLNMVANPVSPQLDKSIITSAAASKKSVDSDDGSPVFLCSNELFATTCCSSTPEIAKTTLLDQTPPSVVRKLPVLSPTHKRLSDRYPLTYKSPTIKKDFALFRQYRFVGSTSSDDEEVNYQTAEPEIDLLFVSQIEQEHDPNVNVITHLEEQKKALSILSKETVKKETSLPTMYVVDRSNGRPRSKSTSSIDPMPLRNIDVSSYEDESLLWKLSQQIAPHESLECEISQAKLVDSKNAELKNTLYRLVKENNRLKSQIKSGIEKVKNYSPERRERYYETECRALKVRIQDLESDNNHKYIKIIDLMEEKEKLQKELKRVNGKDTDEINKLKQNISELHHEKCRILRELQQGKWDKQNCGTIFKHFQLVKHECDLLQGPLQHAKKYGEDLVKELEKMSTEKCELRARVVKLTKSICEMNDKNNELNIKLQNLSDEYVKLKKTIKVKTMEGTGLLKTHDNMNPELNKLVKENEELTYEQSCYVPEETCRDRKGLHLHLEEMKTLKNVIAEHKSTIELLKKEITDLSATNSKLSQNTIEKENQILGLKQIIVCQNESLKVITEDKETSTTRLYKQQCENETLYENNKELTKNNNELGKQLERMEKEKEYMCIRLNNLEEENKSILAEFKIITGDYKNMKDSDNTLLKEYKILVTEKELLTKTNEQLRNDYKKIKDLKGEIEQQLLDIKNEAKDLLNPEQRSSPTKLLSLKRKSQEVQDHSRFTKELSMIRQKISELDNSNKLLQIENEKLQEDFNGIRNNYEKLAHEKEMWLTEKKEWQQLKDDLSNKLTTAMTESKVLEEQLSNSSRSSQEYLQTSEGPCSNCVVLKTEIEDLNKRLNELQDQNSKKNQSRRYDRTQIIIEKLKNKTHGAEEQLKSEIERNVKLELENTKLKAEMQGNWKKYTKENAKLEFETSRLQKEVQENLDHYKLKKVDMAAKLSNLEEQLKELQKGMQEAEQEKRFVLQDCNTLKEKLEVAVKEKETRMKSINKETSQLKQEIQELIKQKTKLEKKLGTSENLLKCKPNIDKLNKENSQLKQDIEEANKQIADCEKKLVKVKRDFKEKLELEQELKDNQESIVKENLYIKQQMEELEKKLEKSEAENVSIRKEFVHKHRSISSYNDVIESSEYSSTEKLVQQNDTLEKQLNSYENELVEIKIKLNDSSNCLHLLSEHVKDVNRELNEKRQRLHRSTLTAVSNWRETLEMVPDKIPVLEVFDKGEPAAPHRMFIGPLDEEIFKFKHQIHVSSLVLDTLSKLKTSIPSSKDAETQVSPSIPQRYAKRFVSKTSTGLSRSVSPDSPFQKDKSRRTNTSLLRRNTTPTLHIQRSEALLGNSPRLFTSVKNISLQRTTTGPLRSKYASAIPIRSRETSPVNKSRVYVSSDSSCHCTIDANVAGYNSPQDDDTDNSTLSEDEDVETGLGTNKNYSSLSNSTLDSLGLLYDGDSINWSKKEIEEKFHILVTCFMMDIGTIKERYKKHLIHQNNIENRFSLESEKIVATLKGIKKLDSDHQVKLLVTTCLHQVKQMVWMFSQISVSAMQYGVLQHEQHSLKIINVMINHAANLRQVVENSTLRLKSIGSSTNSPKHKKSRDVSVDNSSSSSLQLKVSSIFEFNNDESQELSDLSINEATEKNDSNYHLPASVSCGLNNEAKDEQHSRIGTGIIQFCLLLFLTVLAIVLIGFQYTSNGISMHGCPWRWVSWNDIFAPFIKRSYPQDPPPT